jgi:hypothetical protein
VGGKRTSPEVICSHCITPKIMVREVTRLPQVDPEKRSPRLRLAEDTPIVLRCLDGHRVSGKLRCVSLTGGLIVPDSHLPPGSLVSLIFVTPKGPIVGTANMLRPVSWREQPFCFATVLDSHQERLRAIIKGSARQADSSRNH